RRRRSGRRRSSGRRSAGRWLLSGKRTGNQQAGHCPGEQQAAPACRIKPHDVLPERAPSGRSSVRWYRRPRLGTRRDQVFLIPVTVAMRLGAPSPSAAVIVGHVLGDSGQRFNSRVVRREMADRIGGARIAGEQEGLATTTAEILLATLAALAGLLHPIGAAEGVEGRRRCPD